MNNCKKWLLVFSTIFILMAVVMPTPIFAAEAGIKPSSALYFLDVAFEKVELFFTFNPEATATKALEYADERLAEIQITGEEKDSNAVKAAIANYEGNIALAVEKTKEVTDKEKAEELLISIANNASKHQEILAAVLVKVPEEAKEAIAQAIEASKKSNEGATKQIAESRAEVKGLKKEAEELRATGKEQEKVIEELGKQKSKSTSVSTQPSTPSIPDINKEQITALTPTPKTIITPSTNGGGGGGGGATPATPATPAVPATPATPPSGGGGGGGGGGATPATPATPAIPATPAQPTPQPDTTAPVISNIQATNITETSATITWTTDEAASSEVNYNSFSFTPATTTPPKMIGADGTTNHSVNLSSLTNSKTYYYTVISKDTAGNTATSSEESFTTAAYKAVSIIPAGYSGQYPSIAWTGNDVGIAYTKYLGLNSVDRRYAIYFAKVDINGNTLVPEKAITDPINLSEGPWGISTVADLKPTSGGFEITWNEYINGADVIKKATLDSSGNVISGPATSSPSGRTEIYNYQGYASVEGSSGYGFVSVTSDNRSVEFVLKDSSGNEISSPITLDTTSYSYINGNPSIAWNGSTFGVVWFNNETRTNYYTRINASGTKEIGNVALGNGIINRIPHIEWADTLYYITWTGHYYITWAGYIVDSNHVMASTIDIDGGQIGSYQDIYRIQNTDGKNDAAWNGSVLGITWSDQGSLWFATTK
ncbi:MAG: DUF5667 domain-containing protein [bacterium]|nr:DUF5667 domain-containing protein [bacterium]